MPRPCSICNHAERGEIEAALEAGETLRSIAERFGTSTAALSRHKAHMERHYIDEDEYNFDGYATVLICESCGSYSVGISGWHEEKRAAIVYCSRCDRVGYLLGLSGSLIKSNKKLSHEIRRNIDVPPWLGTQNKK